MLVRNIRDAIHDDDDLIAWCQANYDQRHKVYCGVDMKNPPQKTDYPLIHVFPVKRQTGMRFESQSNFIGITVGLINEDTTASEAAVAGRSAMIEMQGVSHIETMRLMVQSAAAGADLQNGWIDSLEVDYSDPVELFPFWVCEIVLEIKGIFQMGDSML